MLALPISMPRFKSNSFCQNSLKIKLFLQTNAKFSSVGGSAPRPPSLRRLEALPPDSQFPAAGGFARKPPMVSRGSGLHSQTPVPPAAGVFAPRFPASSGSGLRSQTFNGFPQLGALPQTPKIDPS